MLKLYSLNPITKMKAIKFCICSGFLLFTLFSCQKEIEEKKISGNSGLEIRTPFDSLSVGERHNILLADYSTRHYFWDSITAAALVKSIDSVWKGNSPAIAPANFTKAYVTRIMRQFEPDGIYNDLSNSMFSHVMDSLRTWYPTPSYSLLDTIELMFRDGNIDIQRLKTLSGITAMNIYEREVVDGAISVIEYSQAFWDLEPDGDPGEEKFIIQLDALGYVLGWGKSVYGEIIKNGHLDVSNQWSRINDGLWTSATLSSGRLIKSP